MRRYSYLWFLPALVCIAAGGTIPEATRLISIETQPYLTTSGRAADGRSATQQPLVPLKTNDEYLNPIKSGVTVGLWFRSPRAEYDSYVRIPLRKRVKPGDFAGLLHRPSTARICNVHSQLRARNSLDRYGSIQNIVCRVYPALSPEERSMRGRYRRFKLSNVEPVWFTMGDGEVDFMDPRKMWFLAGRVVESYECV